MKITSTSLDKFLEEYFIVANGMLYNDKIIQSSSGVYQDLFRDHNGQYSINNNVIAVVYNGTLYVSPLGYQLEDELIKYNFKESGFWVPFSQNIYFDYPFKFGPDTTIRIASQTINDPFSSLKFATEQIFENPTFKKWDSLVQKYRGFSLIEYYKKMYKTIYGDSENTEKIEKLNERLRQAMLTALETKPEIFQDSQRLQDKLDIYYKNIDGMKRK